MIKYLQYSGVESDEMREVVGTRSKRKISTEEVVGAGH